MRVLLVFAFHDSRNLRFWLKYWSIFWFSQLYQQTIGLPWFYWEIQRCGACLDRDWWEPKEDHWGCWNLVQRLLLQGKKKKSDQRNYMGSLFFLFVLTQENMVQLLHIDQRCRRYHHSLQITFKCHYCQRDFYHPQWFHHPPTLFTPSRELRHGNVLLCRSRILGGWLCCQGKKKTKGKVFSSPHFFWSKRLMNQSTNPGKLLLFF